MNLPGYGDRASAPHAWAMMEAPDGPYCDRCGGCETMTDEGDHEYGPTYTCLYCEKRREMHRGRGRQFCRRVRRLGQDRSLEAWKVRGGPRVHMEHARFQACASFTDRRGRRNSCWRPSNEEAEQRAEEARQQGATDISVRPISAVHLGAPYPVDPSLPF